MEQLGLYVSTFFHDRDVLRVINDDLWTFNRQALLLKQMKLLDRLGSMDMNGMEIWVQIYKLPMGFMNEKVVEQIGNGIEKNVKTTCRVLRTCGSNICESRYELMFENRFISK
ncbi:hypothetical protein Sjap_008668 [Stephania japonica]|uniref:DUF4283 domain-containing protein n=1 Tax=Stephania japonica TaxID=461633 RepID=A0AAP0JQF7_9MAGN